MRPVILMALALWAGSAAAEATLVSIYPWTETLPRFGGLSGLEITDDGRGFIALSDKGILWRGRLIRTDGAITGTSDVTRMRLRNEDGRPIEQDRDDSEGLALAPDGSLFVSFEGPARVWHYATPDRATPLPAHPDFAGMIQNASLEALAIGPDGALYTMPERSGRADRPFEVYRFANGAWSIPFKIPRRGPFLLSGADVGPDGRLYVLERDFAGIGFRSRVRRFNLDGSGEAEVFSSRIGQFDNLEGLSVWQDDTGAIRLTMVADDNFLPVQQTQLVEYRLD